MRLYYSKLAKNSISKHFLTQAIVLFCLCEIGYCQINITGILAPATRMQMFNYSLNAYGYGPNDLIKIKLRIISSGMPLSTTSLMATFSPNGTQILSPSHFYHVNPKDLQIVDLDAMWNSRDQYINLRRSSQDNLYLTLMNFDPIYRQSQIRYAITVQPSNSANGYNCEPCSNNQRVTSDCFCRYCAPGMFGKICSRTIQQLHENKAVLFPIMPEAYKYYYITRAQKIVIQVTATGGTVQVYLQFQHFEGEVANFYNLDPDIASTPWVVSNTQLKLSVNANSKKLLVTAASFTNSSVTFQIKYYQQSELSSTAIVLIIIGSVLIFSIIVIVICCKIKKSSNRTAQQNQSDLILNSKNRLSPQQVELYFPTFTLEKLNRYLEKQNKKKSKKSVRKQADLSMATMKSSNKSQVQLIQDIDAIGSSHKILNEPNNEPSIKQQNIEQKGAVTEDQCVICLQKILLQHQVKMGYCKHIIHADCLTTWFKKQQSCPYCRKQYTRDQTIQQYNKLHFQLFATNRQSNKAKNSLPPLKNVVSSRIPKVHKHSSSSSSSSSSQGESQNSQIEKYKNSKFEQKNKANGRKNAKQLTGIELVAAIYGRQTVSSISRRELYSFQEKIQ